MANGKFFHCGIAAFTHVTELNTFITATNEKSQTAEQQRLKTGNKAGSPAGQTGKLQAPRRLRFTLWQLICDFACGNAELILKHNINWHDKGLRWSCFITWSWGPVLKGGALTFKARHYLVYPIVFTCSIFLNQSMFQCFNLGPVSWYPGEAQSADRGAETGR